MTEIQLSKAYDFAATEGRVYKSWDERGYFSPSNDPNKPGFDPTRKPFVISIPPPNVTGELHLGHAMFVSMEDLMIRYHRMKGEPTLWVPGTDHAGIATHLQIEKALEKEELHREDIGREEFLKRIWIWKEKYGGIITSQIRRLGASCDWSRERFTMDAGLSKAVREAFVRLFEKGLIYRGPRLINWSPYLRTAVSDLEVEYSQEPGTLYFFKYKLADNPDEFIPVATTRPETILGDTAVAVHPKDPRYQAFVGRKVVVPVIGRMIPVISDTYVDREFGTGALKITPAHDPNDYEIAQRHGLEMISILNKDASINENGAPYQGLDRFECRKRFWADMRAVDLVIKEEPYTLNVPRSQRGGEIIEPMISEQWFVTIKPLAEKAIQAVRDGSINIIPEHFTKVYFNWMENIQDWCISRQLWWGHRIPVWYCSACGKMTVMRTDPSACTHCGSTDIRQDEDVLDTWFSSGLWPFSTLGWPDQTPDFKYFYPTSVMETGYDILFFWVARMIMDGLEFTGQAPFHTVYLHGLIRDEKGQKMSKTKGNSIDPLGVMDQFGTDALRFTMLVGSAPGADMNLSVKKVEANRNFANKLWNAGRFVISSLQNVPEKPQSDPHWTLADEWIHARTRALIRDVNRLFESYQFGEAGRQIYDFFWSEFADWYIEIAKNQIAQGVDRAFYTAQTLIRVLDRCLRMLHPFTPFVTEELWGHLKQAAQSQSSGFSVENGWADALIIARWPEVKEMESWETPAIDEFTRTILEPVKAIRFLRTENKRNPGEKITITLISETIFEQLNQNLELVKSLTGSSVELISQQIPKQAEYQSYPSTSISSTGTIVFLHNTSFQNSALGNLQLEKELSEAIQQIARLEGLLNSDFTSKAPPLVVEKEKQRLDAYRQTVIKIQEQLKK